MKSALIAAGLIAGLAACEGREVDSDADTGMAVDTIVTERTVQDTAVVTTDTTISVDTTIDRGEQGVGVRDTVRDTRPTGANTGSQYAAPESVTVPADSQ